MTTDPRPRAGGFHLCNRGRAIAGHLDVKLRVVRGMRKMR